MHSSEILSTLFWVTFVAFLLLEAILFWRDTRIRMEKHQDDHSKGVLVILSIAGIILAFAAHNILPQWMITTHTLHVLLAGTILMWIGILFRIWAIFTLGTFFRRIVYIHENHHVITKGPYRIIRHPAYAGSLMTFLGFGIALDNWIAILCSFGLLFIAMVRRIRVEDSVLQNALGDKYIDYMQKTKRLIPFVW